MAPITDRGALSEPLAHPGEAPLAAWLATFLEALARLRNEQQPEILQESLRFLEQSLDALGAAYLTRRDNEWQIVEACGAVTRDHLASLGPDADAPGYEVVEGAYHVVLPVYTGEEPASLLLRLHSFSPDPPRLRVLKSAAHALGEALERERLLRRIHALEDDIRAMDASHGRKRATRSSMRRFGKEIDPSGGLHPLASTTALEPEISPYRVVLPLEIHDETLGNVVLEEETARAWTEDELELARAVTAQMARALEAATLFRESERRAAQLTAAAEIGRAASGLLSLEQLMATAVEQIRRTFGYYHAQIFLVDEQGKWAELRSSTGEVGAALLARKHRLRVGSKSVIGQVTLRGEPIVARDTDTPDVPWRFNELLPETRSELAVPLTIGSQVIGALDVQSLEPDAFYPEDIAVLQLLADQITIAIQNARAFEQQRQVADQLRQLDRLKSQFLANMSHELRTPLNSIIGFSRVILKGIDGPITELQQKDLKTIYNSGQILLQLIDSILDISKLEAGKMDLNFEEVDLRQLIDVAMSTAAGLVRDKAVTLHKELPATLPMIRADAVRLRQVLLNLLSNAAKFTDEGEISLAVTLMGNEVMITVEDTGLGIPPEKQKHLFDAFYQVDGSATRRVGGTGLGLAISRSFVELHGGRIWVESSGVPGTGSTFYVTLPTDGPSDEVAGASRAPLILAVGNDPGVTMLYSRYLEPEGYRVVSCHDTGRSIEMAEEHEPALLLLDGQDGQDEILLIRTLRDNEGTREVPVILCTVAPLERIEAEAREAGATLVLQKPVLRMELVTVVHRLVESG